MGLLAVNGGHCWARVSLAAALAGSLANSPVALDTVSWIKCLIWAICSSEKVSFSWGRAAVSLACCGGTFWAFLSLRGRLRQCQRLPIACLASLGCQLPRDRYFGRSRVAGAAIKPVQRRSSIGDFPHMPELSANENFVDGQWAAFIFKSPGSKSLSSMETNGGSGLDP